MASATPREFLTGGSTLFERIFSRNPLSPFLIAASGLAVAAFLLAFAGARAESRAHVASLTVAPLHGPVGRLVLPHLSQVPDLPALAKPAAKPKPVVRKAAVRKPVVHATAAPKPAPPRQPVTQPKPRVAPPAAAPAPVKHTRSPPVRKREPVPVVIVGNG